MAAWVRNGLCRFFVFLGERKSVRPQKLPFFAEGQTPEKQEYILCEKEGKDMEYERRRDTVLVRLEGELDQCSAQSVRRELDALLDDPSVRRLILDMKNMDFMDSSGIGVILGRYRILSQRRGSLAVRNMNPHVAKIFYLSGMGQIIEML